MVIGIWGLRGGAGTSTCTVNVATILEHLKNKKVLVVDVDDKSDSSDRLLINNSPEGMPRMDAYLNGKFHDQLAEMGVEVERLYYGITPILRKAVIFTKTGRKELDISVLPACSLLSVYPVEPLTVKEMLEPVKDKFDVCIIDMPAELLEMTYSALVACDYVLIMARPDYDSFKHWGKFTEATELIRNEGWNLNLKTLGICINEFESFSGARSLMSMLESVDDIRDYILDTKIPHSGIINTANVYNVPIIHFAPKAPATKIYIKLVEEILTKIEFDRVAEQSSDDISFSEYAEKLCKLFLCKD